MLARRILARQPRRNQEIVVITDGEPTAHFEDGQVEFSYPPTRRTISETLREVAALHEGRDHDQHVHARAVAGAGRVRGARDASSTAAGRSTPTPERLGEYVLVDFVGRRTKRVS